MDGWRVLGSRRLLERRWLTIVEQHVALPSGVEIEEFHVVEEPDWVAILALTPAGDVVVVDQYRHGFGAVSRELPAGVIDPGETPLQTAQRELREETGYEAPEWRPLLRVATEPHRHTNDAHYFVATGARRVAAPRCEPDEQIEVTPMSPEALLAAVDAGAIVHGLHVAAILMAHRQGLFGKN